LECPTLFRVDATLSGGNTVIHGHLYGMCWKCRARLAGQVRVVFCGVLGGPVRVTSISKSFTGDCGVANTGQ
jgi:hypothetical protein